MPRRPELLIEQGFEQSKIVIPADHFHLLALSRRENGVTITIEIHHGLYPPCPPWYKQPPVADFVERGKVFDAGGRDLLSMGDVDMLRYLYQHAIRTPLVYESFRLINIADIIGQVETCFDTIDWRSLGERYPQLLNGLPLLHRVVPWRSDIAEYFRISRYNGRLNRPPHSFNGWPTVKFRQQRSRGGSVMDLMRATFFSLIMVAAHLLWGIIVGECGVVPAGNTSAPHIVVVSPALCLSDNTRAEPNRGGCRSNYPIMAGKTDGAVT